MASALHTKINSYTLERGIEFADAVSTNFAVTGSNTFGTWTTNGTITASSDAPPGAIGGGSWLFQGTTSAATQARLQTTTASTTDFSGWLDNDWTIGFWFKPNGIISGTSLNNQIFFLPNNSILVNLTGSSASTAQKFGFLNGANTVYSPFKYQANKWYYIAIRRVGSTGTNYQYYINGALIGTSTNASAATTGTFMIGPTSAYNSAITYNISNLHFSTSANVDANAIWEIYKTGHAITGWNSHIANNYAKYWWKFEDADPTTAITNNGWGTMAVQRYGPSGGITANTGGKIGKYLDFPNGNNASTGRAGWQNVNSLTGEFTATKSIEFWMRRNGTLYSNSSNPCAVQFVGPSSFIQIGYGGAGSANQDKLFASYGGLSNSSGRATTASITDGQWHHVVLSFLSASNCTFYVDGVQVGLQDTTGLGTFDVTNLYIGGNTNNTDPFVGNIDDVVIYDYALTAGMVAKNYEAAQIVSAVNGGYTAEVSTATALSPDATVNTTSAVDVTYNATVVGTANALTVDPTITITQNVNQAAEPMNGTNALFVDPVISVIANIDYPATSLTASSLMVNPTVATTKTVDVLATPLLVSALMSARVFSGDTVQDTAYNINIRKLTTTTNNSGNNGFIIGATKNNGTVQISDAIAIKPNSGFPTYNKLVKVKFNSAHVSYLTSGDVNPSNYFKVYVFTANPGTTFDTMNLTNIPAKEYLWTTRLVDDGSSNEYYLDLTAAFADIRAHTYGVYVELDTDTVGGGPSGTYYDRTEWTGTNLNNQLFYVLTSEFISANSNAAVSTASADIVGPTVYTEKYVDVFPTPLTASALFVDPTVSAAISVNPSATVSTASALSVDPTITIAVNYTSGHFEADARTGTNDPVITVVSNKTIAATVLTASALFHEPQSQIGENNTVSSMDASAIMPGGIVVINETVLANAMISTAEFVNPASNQQLNALVNAQTLTVSATFVAPPQYVLLTDDIWYNRLTAQNYGITNYAAFVKFFNQQTSQTNGTVINDLPGETNNGDLTGTLTVGSSDLVGRKAVRLQGLIDHNPANYYPALTRKTWSLEATIKTTVANQILAQGTTVNPDISYDYWSGNITLYNGKISVNTNLGINKNATPSYNSTSVLGTSNVADGNWHHIVVQHDGTRTQIWVDGQLDVQSLSFVAPNVPVPSQIGSATSDFYVSVWSLSEGVLLSERELALNYWASLKYSPIQPAPLTASAVSGNHLGKGNQKKAIMLYYWSTRSQDNPNFYYNAQGGFSTSTQREVSGIYQENKEQGEFDIDYGINLSTWNAGQDGLAGQDFYGWKVYPVDITGKYVSPIVKQTKYSNITTASSGTGLTWPQSDGFKDARYGYNRYIDILNDIDLTDVDAIFFRNYPDDQIERAQFMQDQVVDEYFRVYEKQLHEDFLTSLRKAVDTGVSLLVNHPQLAVDLGIVDRVETIEQLSDYGSTAEGNYAGGGDPRSRALSPAGTLDDNGWYVDSYRNNRFRVVNTITGLTDEPTAILTDYAYWVPGTNAGFTNIARNLTRIEYKPNGLLVGDEFIIHSIPATEGTTTNLRRMLAVPSENVKAGKAITKFGANIYNGTTSVPNPYADYVTTIAVEPGDSLNGTAVGGKIFVTFTDLNKVQIDGTGAPIEYWSVETSTRKVLSVLLARGTITPAQYNDYNELTYDTKYENNEISSQEFNLRNYWTQNDWDLQIGASGSTGQVINVNQNGNVAGQQNRTAVNPGADTTTSNIYSSGGASWFTLTVGRQFDVFKVYSKSMLSKGLTWLATRISEAGTVTRPTALGSYAVMVNPVVQAEKNVTINVQAMLSAAEITQNGYGNDRTVVSLPMIAQATITPKVTRIIAPVLTASARLADNIEEIVYQADQVVMYILHTDAILYVREDVIK